MGHIKNFNEFKQNESILGGLTIGILGGTILGVLFLSIIEKSKPALSTNLFKNMKRWYKSSKVIRKYDKLIKELDNQFDGDLKLNNFYDDIKKLDHHTSRYYNQTDPLYYVNELKTYIISKLNPELQVEFNNLMNDMENEIYSIGYDVYGDERYVNNDND